MTPEELLGLSIFLAAWILPVPLAGWILKRKGHSPHWMWIGILPIAGLLVLLVSIVLTARSDNSEGSSVQDGEQASVACARYEKGMRELGNGLIALGVLCALLTPILLLADTPFPVRLLLGTSLIIMTVVYFVLGVFARKLQAWVNYVVAALGSIGLALNLMNLAMGPAPEQPNPGSSPGGCIGFLVAAALLYYSVNNIQYRRRAKRAGAQL